MSILILAWGNTLRHDDGAGLLLGQKLHRLWLASGIEVGLLTGHQLLPELAEELASAGVDLAVFVDTEVASSAEQQAIITPVVSQARGAALGHHLDPSSLLHLAKLLYGRAPNAYLVTVPGFDFSHGEGLSEMALLSVEKALWLVSSVLGPASSPGAGAGNSSKRPGSPH